MRKYGNLPAFPEIYQHALINGFVDAKFPQGYCETPHSVSFTRKKAAPSSVKPDENFTVRAESKIPDAALMEGPYKYFIFASAFRPALPCKAILSRLRAFLAKTFHRDALSEKAKIQIASKATWTRAPSRLPLKTYPS